MSDETEITDQEDAEAAAEADEQRSLREPVGSEKRTYVKAGWDTISKSHIRPWDRREDEPSRCYLAFCAFRDMGPTRKVKRVWFEVLAPGASKLNGTLFNWAKDYKWTDRCAAYDIWLNDQQKVGKQKYDATEAARLERNKKTFRDNELFLAEQAFAVAAKILATPLTKRSFIEMKDGKTIYHKPHMLSPGHLLAATALFKAGSEIGRKALGIQDDDGEEMTAERFSKLFFRNTGQVAQHLPTGAMPVVPDNAAVNPGVIGREGVELSKDEAKQFKGPIERP